MSFSLLTPLGLLVAIAGLLPLAAFVLTRRRAERVREALRIESPGGRSPLVTGGAIVLLTALVAIAVAQPVVRRSDDRRVRTDAQAYYVFDISRSMLAARSATAPTRLGRAQRMAIRLRAELQEVPSGIAGLTDRILPNLFPTSDDEVFTATVEQSVGVDRPPPRGVDEVTTLFAAFDTMAGDNFFDPGIPRRLVIFFTDGESGPYDTVELDRTLRTGNRIRFVIVRFGDRSEEVYYQGKPVPAYRPLPDTDRIVEEFARTVKATAVLGERDFSKVLAASREALGTGPAEESGQTLTVVPLARWFLLAALVPLGALLWRRNLV
jgi:hypothetical protein